jgi:hypothetical protein
MTTAPLIQQFGQNRPGWSTWFKRQILRRSLNRAITRAYTSFVREYPDWVDYFFDEYFLSQRAFPLLADYMAKNAMPTPSELARVWTEQFTWFNPEMKERHMAQLMPVAADFLRRLDREVFN